MDVLSAVRQVENTIVVFLADHGDMLGERGLWFKMSFFEWSARVPFMISAPGIEGRAIRHPVSIIDATMTFADLAGLDREGIAPWTDGASLLPDMTGHGDARPVLMEYTAEASISPIVAVRDGDWKYVQCNDDPPLLFNLVDDPDELTNGWHSGRAREAAAKCRAVAEDQWHLESLDAAVRRSQIQRLVVYDALRNGHYFPWDFQPLQLASERYMRNHMDLNELDASTRFPRGE